MGFAIIIYYGQSFLPLPGELDTFHGWESGPIINYYGNSLEHLMHPMGRRVAP